MKHLLLLLGLTYSFVYSPNLFAQKAPADFSTKIDSIFSAYQTATEPGCVVGIIKDGKVIFGKGYGVANLEYGVPITPSTVFDVASVSKQFAGFAIATLVEEKKINLDDPIRKYLPDVPDFGHPITIRHLVHHTSGLRDWPGAFITAGWRWEDVISFADIMELVKHQKELDFEPGTQHLYSNTGYNLLAALVEQVSGKTFRAWTTDHIFAPLGMDQSHFLDNHNRVIPNLAYSYKKTAGVFENFPNHLTAYGSSSLYTTLEDLSKWALNFERELAKGNPVYRRMLEGTTLQNGEKVEYGYGVGVSQNRGLQMVSHTGSWAGYRTILAMFPEQQFTVIILANTGRFNLSIYQQVVRLFLENQMTPEEKKTDLVASGPTIRVAPARLAAYEGVYKSPTGLLTTVSLERDTLQILAPSSNSAKYHMEPKTDSSFWVPGSTSFLTFNRDRAGNVYQYDNGYAKATKITPVYPSAKQRQAYLGTYYSAELATEYTVTEKEGHLVLRHRRRPEAVLTPGETDAFGSVLGTLQFVRGKRQKVTGFTVSGGRVRNIHFQKMK